MAGPLLRLLGWWDDRRTNFLARALRQIGPEISDLAAVPSGISLEEESRLLAGFSIEQLVRYLAARSTRGCPKVKELGQLLAGRDESVSDHGSWFQSSDHPLLDAFDVIRDRRSDEVEYFRFWWRRPSLPLSLLIESFSSYGGLYGRLAQSRDDETDFCFRYFRGGALQGVFARGDKFYYSPLDKPGVAGNLSREIVEEALAAAGLEAEGSLLYTTRDMRGYRACRESEVKLRLVGFSFQKRGGYGPWV